MKYKNYDLSLECINKILIVLDKLEGINFIQKKEHIFICSNAILENTYNSLEDINFMTKLSYKQMDKKMNMFADWDRFISDVKKIDVLINEHTVSIFGEIKITNDNDEYRCHINSKKYFGNGHSDEMWIAIIEAMHEALFRN